MSLSFRLFFLRVFFFVQPLLPHHGPENAAPAQDPEKTAHHPVAEGGCCCLVDSVEIRKKGHRTLDKITKHIVVDSPDADPEEFDREIGPQVGYEFKVVIKYRNRRVEVGEKAGDCVLRWLEMSDRPPESYLKAGVKPNEWTDISKTVGKRFPGLFKNGTLGPWKRHKKDCPLPPPGILTPEKVELTDIPTVLHGTSRTMFFHIIVESACKSKPQEVWAMQVLEKDPSKWKFVIGEEAKREAEKAQKTP